jgi:hypothetical protein
MTTETLLKVLQSYIDANPKVNKTALAATMGVGRSEISSVARREFPQKTNRL